MLLNIQDEEMHGGITLDESPKISPNTNEAQESVGVVLVNWNGVEYTIPCIESLRAGIVKPDRIVVVDNASKDDYSDLIMHAFPDVELIRNPENAGFTGANNIGIKRLISLGCRYIWILNNDTVIDENCLSMLKNYMDLHPEASACTGKILYTGSDRLVWYAGAVYHKWTLRFSHRGAKEEDGGQYDQIQEVPFISGCCMFVRREAIEQVGMFDDRFFAYYEDGDWCLRAKKKHLRLIYIPQAVIWHKVSATVDKLRKQEAGGTTSPFSVYITSRNRLYIIRKHSESILQMFTASLAAAAWFTYYATALLVLLRIEKVRALAMAVYDGIVEPLESTPDHALTPRYLR